MDDRPFTSTGTAEPDICPATPADLNDLCAQVSSHERTLRELRKKLRAHGLMTASHQALTAADACYTLWRVLHTATPAAPAEAPSTPRA